jgi:hypothetical protein
MNPQNYSYSITANVTPSKAINAISRVSEWWATDFKGKSQKPGDVFTVHFGETSVTFKILEVVRGKRIEWKVTDCYLPWLKDKKEWNNTILDWDISNQEGSTQINFTHIGLVPQLECYNDCKEGWNFHIGESLFRLMTEHEGTPDVNTREKRIDQS